MKTSNLVIELKKFIQSRLRCDVIIGDEDFSASQYPLVNILFNSDFEAVWNSSVSMSIEHSITIRFIGSDSKEDMLKILDLFDDYCKNIGEFRYTKGNENFSTAGTCEHQENNFILTTNYRLYNTVQK